MSDRFDTMMDPRVEDLLDRTHSKFGLVSLAARRARQINSYYGQLGDGLGTIVPPQVPSTASKSLSIAFEEILDPRVHHGVETIGHGSPVAGARATSRVAAEQG